MVPVSRGGQGRKQPSGEAKGEPLRGSGCEKGGTAAEVGNVGQDGRRVCPTVVGLGHDMGGSCEVLPACIVAGRYALAVGKGPPLRPGGDKRARRDEATRGRG